MFVLTFPLLNSAFVVTLDLLRTLLRGDKPLQEPPDLLGEYRRDVQREEAP